jgi:hypothetical protein
MDVPAILRQRSYQQAKQQQQASVLGKQRFLLVGLRSQDAAKHTCLLMPYVCKR